MLNKSPSGSLCPYYYMGGELYPLKYGSYFENSSELLKVMAAEEAFVLSSPGQHNRRIWVDLYETKLDDAVISALARHIKAIEHKILKLCFVGCSPGNIKKIKKQFEHNQISIPEPVRFFADPEEAKWWLVGAGG